MDKIKLVEAAQIRKDMPDFHIGDTITVFVKVIEGDKERIQQFKGIVMGIKGSGLSKTFRVRKISNGVGVERIFPFNSPKISKVEIIRHGSIRRAKLYYLRNLTGKAATKIKEKKRKIFETVIEPPAADVSLADTSSVSAESTESKE
jgi:large subunit ribosomal protein L19